MAGPLIAAGVPAAAFDAVIMKLAARHAGDTQIAASITS
jgi:hypothetical protein